MALTDDVTVALAELQVAVTSALAQKDVQLAQLTAQIAESDRAIIAMIEAMTAKLSPL